jgi:hypothetical protein
MNHAKVISRLAVVLAAVLAWQELAVAAGVTFPTEGYYRPGRYMPVIVEGEGEVRISAEGAVTTVVPAGGPARRVIPFLIVGSSARGLSVVLNGQDIGNLPQLRPLGNDEQLAGVAADVQWDPTREEHHKLIRIRLDPANPLPGPAIAWQSLDMVVMSSEALGRIDSENENVLRDGGTRIVVIQGKQPVDRIAVGPGGAMFSESAYLPTYAWQPAWPRTFRIYVLAAAGGFAIVLVLAAMLRTRSAVWIATGVVAVALMAGGIWKWRSPAVFSAAGEVLPQRSQDIYTQHDRWYFQSARRATQGAFRWQDVTWPMFFDRSHFRQTQMQLHCDPRGEPVGFVYQLPANGRVAFLTRRWAELSEAPFDLPVRSPLAGLVDQLYRSNSAKPLGARSGDHFGASIESWPAIGLSVSD